MGQEWSKFTVSMIHQLDLVCFSIFGEGWLDGLILAAAIVLQSSPTPSTVPNVATCSSFLEMLLNYKLLNVAVSAFQPVFICKLKSLTVSSLSYSMCISINNNNNNNYIFSVRQSA